MARFSGLKGSMLLATALAAFLMSARFGFLGAIGAFLGSLLAVFVAGLFAPGVLENPNGPSD